MKMDAIVAQIDEQNGWDRLFREIKLIAAGYDYQCKTARLPENKTRNRYRDVSPFDHSRVKLQDSENDYINGSLVEVPKSGRRYILAQGPLMHTCGHFWQMVWEQKSAAVIMLNRIVEKGAVKCSPYFPRDENPLVFPDVKFTVTVKRQQVTTNYKVRYLELQNNNTDEVKDILQFHYTTWPDFGVPDSPAAFLDFLNCVRDSGVLEPNVGPPVIHCSAGIGRSGTFALVDSCLVFIERDIEFDVKETLLEMRTYRMGLIQTVQQLRFSYLAIAEGARSMRDLSGGEIESTETSESELPAVSSSDEQEQDTEKKPNGTDGSETEKDQEESSASHTQEEQQRDQQRDITEDEVKPADKMLPVNNHEEPEKPKTQEANNNPSELRKRKISERNEALKKQVSDIKNKMKQSEERQNSSSWTPFLIGGLVVAVSIGLAVLYRTYQ